VLSLALEGEADNSSPCLHGTYRDNITQYNPSWWKKSINRALTAHYNNAAKINQLP